MKGLLFIFSLVFLSALPIKSEEKLIQSFLDYPSLQSYFHSDKEGRSKLYILDNNKISTNLSLKKFGEEVSILESKNLFFLGTNNYILFDSVSMSESKAYLKASYIIEGITIEAAYEYVDEVWSAKSFTIKEKKE